MALELRHQTQQSGETDEFVRLAAELCNVSRARICLLSDGSACPLCRQVASTGRTLVIEDTLDHPLSMVRSEVLAEGTRFYAGAPLIVDGVPVGALCLRSPRPHSFALRERRSLVAIARTLCAVLAKESALNALGVNEELYTAALQFGEVGVIVFAHRDEAHAPAIEFVNDAAARRIELPTSLIIAQPTAFYSIKGHPELVDTALRHAREHNESTFDCNVAARNGGERWIECRARPLAGTPASPFRFVLLSRDITARKSDESYRALLAEAIERTPEGIFIIRMTGTMLEPNIVYANPLFKLLTGFDPALEMPRLFGRQTDLSLIEASIADIMAGRRTSGETTIYRADGSTFVGRWNAYPIDSPDRHAVVILSDVTDARAQEQQLHLLSTAVEEASDFVVVMDETPPSKGGPFIVYTNRAFQDATGYAPDDLVGKPHTAYYSPNNPYASLEQIRAALENGHPTFREMLVQRKDGSEFWMETVGKTFRRSSDGSSFRMSIGRDITLRRRAFNQIALLYAANEQSQHPVMLYEPDGNGVLEVVYENEPAAKANRHRLSDIWSRDDDVARAMKIALERGDDINETFADVDDDGSPMIVHFWAKAVRTERGIEGVLTAERVLAHAMTPADEGNQLLNLATVLPALAQARGTQERLGVLRALLHRAFDAELTAGDENTARSVVIDATARTARFGIAGRSMTATWPRALPETAMTAMRFAIEVAIEQDDRGTRNGR